MVNEATKQKDTKMKTANINLDTMYILNTMKTNMTRRQQLHEKFSRDLDNWMCNGIELTVNVFGRAVGANLKSNLVGTQSGFYFPKSECVMEFGEYRHVDYDWNGSKKNKNNHVRYESVIIH